MIPNSPALEHVVDQVLELVKDGHIEQGLEVLLAFGRADGDSVTAGVSISKQLIGQEYCRDAIVVLNSVSDSLIRADVLVLRGLARLGLGHCQPSVADFEVALSRGLDDATRHSALNGVVSALRALAIVRNACPLYSRKAQLYEGWASAESASVDSDVRKRWTSGEWAPGVAFGGVEFGDVLPDALLHCIRVLPDNEEERWCFIDGPRIVIATDLGRLDLVNTWASVNYQDHDLIGICRERLESILGPPDGEEEVLDMVYLSYNTQNIDVVLHDGVATHAVLTGDGPDAG